MPVCGRQDYACCNEHVCVSLLHVCMRWCVKIHACKGRIDRIIACHARIHAHCPAAYQLSRCLSWIHGEVSNWRTYLPRAPRLLPLLLSPWQVTRDGIPVIWHDDDVVYGQPDKPQVCMVKDLDLADFQQLSTPAYPGRASRILRKFRNRDTHIRAPEYSPWECEMDDSLPTLEEIFKQVPVSVGFDIEVRSDICPCRSIQPLAWHPASCMACKFAALHTGVEVHGAQSMHPCTMAWCMSVTVHQTAWCIAVA